jgi:arylsulfatase A-like enzyme
MKSLPLLLLAGGTSWLASLLPAVAAAPATSVTGRPNILFIMVDEMRWNVMGCAGNPLVSTPHLDQLAREGTRFATAYTVAAICTPSRYSAFTSRYAHVHGSTDNSTAPVSGQLLLPALMKHHGYETAISGKLHFLPAEPDYGFDYFWSFTTEGPGKLPRWPEYMDAKHGKNSARRVVPDSRPFPDDPLGKDYAKLPYPSGDMQTSWITDRAIEYLGRRDPAKPYFLFVSFLDPHSPSHLSEPYYSMFQKTDIPLPATFHAGEKAAAGGDSEAGEGKGRHTVSDPAIVRKLTAAYYAKMKLVDENIGRLLTALAQKGQAENTLVIFTADHGNMIGDHNRWFKGVMYEGSSRIPLLMKAPANSAYARTFNQGRVVPEIVENIDIMPTLLEMVGRPLPADPGFQGKSLTRLVAGEDSAWKNIAFSERNSRMVRTGRYKLILIPDRRKGTGAPNYELYDLMADPLEAKNLAADPAHAKVLRELQAKLAAWYADRPPVPRIAGVQTTWTGSPAAPDSAASSRKKRVRPGAPE